MMRQRPKRSLVLAVALACAAALAPAALAGGGQRYDVTVTNLTRGQIFSPPVVVTHDPAIRLFTPGEPASPELALLAEDAVSGPLIGLLGTLPEVADVQMGTDGPIMPGGSTTVTVMTQGKRRQLSVAGMMVTTNDALYAVSGPLDGGATMFRGVGYDAGSEGNTEACSDIPGPPCGNDGVRVPASAEGYVHVHAGIHGIADLAPEQLDWRNPTVRVVVRPIHDDESSDDESSDDESSDDESAD